MAGHITRRGPKAWLVRVSLGRDGNGRRLYHSKVIHGTKKQAETYLNEKLHERDTGVLVPRHQPVTTLDEYSDQWLDSIGVRARTRESYRGVLKRHVRPVLGKLPIGRITPALVRKLYLDMATDDYAPRTIRSTHEVLHNLLEQATEDRLLRANPAAVRSVRRVIPKASKVEHTVIKPDDVAAFLDAARSDRFGAYWLLLLFGGLRPEEALALCWSDLDGNRVHVRRVLIDAAGVPLHFESPKTKKSARTVTLPGVVTDALREHRKRQAAERLKAGPDWKDGNLIFSTLTGGPLRQSFTRPSFTNILFAAELPAMRIYDLRHSCATLLLAGGENAKVVQERLGHASITLTMDTYSHVLPDMQQAAAEKLDQLAGSQ